MPELFRGSLWIRPTGPALDALQQASSRARERCGGPAIDPHVTILGGIALPIDEAKRRVDALAEGFMPFKVQLGRLDWYNEYHRCFFARAEASPELLALYRRAQDIFEIHPRDPYEPHLSLVYGEVGAETKRELARDLGRALEVDFQAVALELVNATRSVPVEKWHTVFRTGFIGNLRLGQPVVSAHP